MSAWSEKQIEYLINNYTNKYVSIESIAKALGKTKNAVSAEAFRRKLKRPSLNKSNEEFELELSRLDIGIINLEPYVSGNTKIKFKCLEGHIFNIVPRSILERKKCPSCSYSGFKSALPAYLYCIEYIIDEFPFYKIGITNGQVQKRLNNINNNDLIGNIIWKIKYDTGTEALKAEKDIKTKYKEHAINTGLLKNGNTETFSVYINEPI